MRTAILSAILVLAVATTGLAASLNYAGYVSKDAQGNVEADTLVCVFNPNRLGIFAHINVYDKDGTLLEALFHNGTGPLDFIPAGGLGWITLGMIFDGAAGPASYPFVIEWLRTPGIQPYRGLVAEVKQIIYNSPQPLEPDNPCWNPAAIKAWSETALCKGKGKWGGGVGYSK